jgi:transposase InsO family protein
MPRHRYERGEPTHDWQELRPVLKDSTQVTYEIIRPVILGWETPKQRAQETGMPQRTIYYKSSLFGQAGMASLLPPEPPPAVPKLDKRSLPPPMRQAIVDLKAEYPAFTLHEIATICYAQFGRRPSAHTIQLILASGPKPVHKQRRYPTYAAIDDPIQKRLAIIRLHTEGWSVKSIAGYLQISRKQVYKTLQRWIEEQFAGLPDKSSAPQQPARKVTMRDMQEVKKLQVNPELGEYRVSAALEQIGIKLSPRTCGRILALNRDLYHLRVPRKSRPKQEHPFKAEKRHQYWSVDSRYLDMHQLENEGMIYCSSILENYSRAILASAITRQQDTQASISVLYAAIRKYGCPETLVSDSGAVFRSHEAMRIYDALGIQKKEIEKGKPWQNYIETCFNVQRRMADWRFELAQTWEDLLAAHEKWLRDYNYQKHLAHEKREDGRHSPAEVLGWVSGRQFESDHLSRAFSAICETRKLNKAGYARFRNFLLYAERGLAGKRALVNIFQDTLALEYDELPLAKYSVEWQPDDHHLLRVGNPRLFEHPYHSAQLSLWPPGEVEWFVILPCETSPRSKRKRKQSNIIQLPLVLEIDQTQQA